MPLIRRIGTLLAIAVAAALLSACAAAGFDAKVDPTAVVLIQDGGRTQLVVIDLQAFRVAKTVRLRSQSFSLDGDAESRTVVTAQCGGVGDDADRVAAVYRLGESRARYVDLIVPNPLEVSVARGKAYLVHGFEQPEGLCVSVVDPTGPGLAGSMHVAPGALSPVGGTAGLLLPVAAKADPKSPSRGGAALMRLADSRVETLSATTPFASCSVVSDPSEDSTSLVLIGKLPSPETSQNRWAVAEVDSSSGALGRLVLAPWVRKAAFAACVTAEGIAVPDTDGGVDLDDPGRGIVTLDRVSLKPVMRRQVKGLPAAVGAWGQRMLVVDGVTGELLLYERGAVRPTRKLRLSSRPAFAADMVVFE